MRKFEKISFEQFKRDINDEKKLYDEYKLPIRKTKYSAGYDFFAIEDITIKPKEIVKIPTGVKVIMNDDEALFFIIRSSLGFKYNTRMTNQVGVIDKDYYNNIDNEGHMFISLQNEGDKELVIKKGNSYVQGIFIKYGIVDDEEEVKNTRTGGLGSTNKEDL